MVVLSRARIAGRIVVRHVKERSTFRGNERRKPETVRNVSQVCRRVVTYLSGVAVFFVCRVYLSLCSSGCLFFWSWFVTAKTLAELWLKIAQPEGSCLQTREQHFFYVLIYDSKKLNDD